MSLVSEYFLGIDGGASKTAGVLCDRSGRILSRCLLGGAPVQSPPRAESLAVLKSSTEELLSGAGPAAGASWHCGIGVHGIDFA